MNGRSALEAGSGGLEPSPTPGFWLGCLGNGGPRPSLPRNSSPHGFYDADSGLSVDGHLIERWEWRPGDSEPVRIE